MKGDREKCIESGASDYIAKPVDPEQLVSMLEAMAAPMREAHDADANSWKQAPRRPPESKLNILLVDDRPENLLAFETMLERRSGRT